MQNPLQNSRKSLTIRYWDVLWVGKYSPEQDERKLHGEQRRKDMNKAELVAAMSETSGLSKKNCETALAAFTTVIERALREEGKVKLVGFGSFEVRTRAARTGRKPGTTQAVEIPAAKVPVFKAGKPLRTAIQS